MIHKNRQPAQAMVLGALALTALLAFVALVLNFGLIVVERRHLQTTADAAALGGAIAVLDQQVPTPGACQTSAVSTQVDRAITANGPFLTDPQSQVTYVDATGAELAGLGAGNFPGSTVGVQVVLSGQFNTLLGGVFDHVDQLQVRAQSQVRLRSPDSLTGPLPIVLPQSLALTHAACSGTAYNLYGDASVLLDLTAVPNAGSYGDGHTNLQYWSDGSHKSGTLTIDSTVARATIGDLSDVQTGLGDNATRQGNPDYIVARIPLCDDSASPGTCPADQPIRVSGFTQAVVQTSQIGLASASAYFVPYVARLMQ